MTLNRPNSQHSSPFSLATAELEANVAILGAKARDELASEGIFVTIAELVPDKIEAQSTVRVEWCTPGMAQQEGQTF